MDDDLDIGIGAADSPEPEPAPEPVQERAPSSAETLHGDIEEAIAQQRAKKGDPEPYRDLEGRPDSFSGGRYEWANEFDAEARRNGTTLQKAVGSYVEHETKLRSDPVSGVVYTLESIGVDPRPVVAILAHHYFGNGNQPQVQPQQWLAQDRQAAQQQWQAQQQQQQYIAQQTAQQQRQAQQAQQAAEAQAHSRIDAFEKAGNEHLPALRQEMAQLIYSRPDLNRLQYTDPGEALRQAYQLALKEATARQTKEIVSRVDRELSRKDVPNNRKVRRK